MNRKLRIMQICFIPELHRVTFTRVGEHNEYFYHNYHITPRRIHRLVQFLNYKFHAYTTPFWLNTAGWSVFPGAA